MLRSLNEVKGYTLAARDGEIGSCADFLFDDRHWAVRYMVADTHKWLPGRKVLIYPALLGQPQWLDRLLPVELTKDEIKNAPDLAEDAPVSMQKERAYLGYFGFPPYWHDGLLWGTAPTPYGAALARAEPPRRAADKSAETESHHLRSAREVEGYDIDASDGSIGHVEDFILDDESWRLAYVVVDTRNWLPGGKKVLLDPKWVAGMEWDARKLRVEVSAAAVRNSPEYDPAVPVSRAYETRLYDHYGKPPPW